MRVYLIEQLIISGYNPFVRLALSPDIPESCEVPFEAHSAGIGGIRPVRGRLLG